MEKYGTIIGLALLVLVSICAFLLGQKAARSINQFREEHHESFIARKRQ
jgi:hypothetical protein